MTNTRITRDNFQSICDQLATAIQLYFAGAPAAGIINLTHSSRIVMRDLLKFHKEKDPRPFEYFELWTDTVDSSKGTGYFHFDKRNGQQGRYVQLGNKVKHANTDPEGLVTICDQGAYEYLRVVLEDFMHLKAALWEEHYVVMHKEHMAAMGESTFKRMGKRAVNKLTGSFLQATFFEQPYSPKTKIDFLCDIFEDWARLIDHAYDRYVRKYQSYQPVGVLSSADWNNIYMTALMAGAEAPYSALGQFVRNKLFPAGNPETNKDVKAVFAEEVSFMREKMRYSTRPIIAQAIQKELSNYSWHGAGYYQKIGDEIPDEKVFVIDLEGYEFKA